VLTPAIAGTLEEKKDLSCPDCNGQRVHDVTTAISALPHILAVSASRRQRKSNRKKTFQYVVPEVLQLDGQGAPATYDLFGTTHHEGTLVTDGHYVACMASAGQWFRLNPGATNIRATTSTIALSEVFCSSKTVHVFYLRPAKLKQFEPPLQPGADCKHESIR